MQAVRRTAMYATLCALGALTVLSIYGAFLGAERAGALFSSPPLVAFWFFLLALLVGCFVVDWRLVRSPGLAAMHLGAALILVGAMLGSDAGHRVVDRLLGGIRTPYGYLRIPEGGETNVLRDPDTEQAIGELPFTVRLKDFRIETYPPGRWNLWFQRPVPPGTSVRQGLTPIPWQVGEPVPVAGTRLHIRVLRYIESARPVRDDAGEVVGAEPDPASATPAMEIEATLHGRSHRGWIVVPEGHDMGGMSLGPLVPKEVAAHAGLALWLARPRPMPKDYFSDVEVLRGGKVVEEGTIEVNHPLHLDGYHLYQMSYEMRPDREVTILSARSDRGLYVVYAGFVLLVGGVFVRFWIEHAAKGLWRRGRLRPAESAAAAREGG